MSRTYTPYLHVYSIESDSCCRLGLYRDAEAQFKSALKHFSTIDMFLYLCKVYVKLDQPMNALDYFHKVQKLSR